MAADSPSPVSPEAEASDPTEFLWKVMGRFDFYIGTVNTKGGLMLAFNTFVIAGTASNWKTTLTTFEGHPFLTVMAGAGLLLGVLGALISSFFAFKAVLPSTKSPKEPILYRSKVFFGDVASFNSGEDYLRELQKESGQGIETDLAKQCHQLAGIAEAKFEHLKWATRAIVVLAIPMLAALALAFLLLVLNNIITNGSLT